MKYLGTIKIHFNYFSREYVVYELNEKIWAQFSMDYMLDVDLVANKLIIDVLDVTDPEQSVLQVILNRHRSSMSIEYSGEDHRISNLFANTLIINKYTEVESYPVITDKFIKIFKSVINGEIKNI